MVQRASRPHLPTTTTRSGVARGVVLALLSQSLWLSGCDNCNEFALECSGTVLLKCTPRTTHILGPPPSPQWEEQFDCAAVGAECRVPSIHRTAPSMSDACFYPKQQCPSEPGQFCLQQTGSDASAPGNSQVVVECEGPSGIAQYRNWCAHECVEQGGIAECRASGESCTAEGATRCYYEEYVMTCENGEWRAAPDRCSSFAPCRELAEVTGPERAACALLPGE